MNLKHSTLKALLYLLLMAVPAVGQGLPQASPLPSGYFAWTIARDDGSALDYYTNFRELEPTKPLAIWMQGSGYFSLFPEYEGKLGDGTLTLLSETLGPEVQLLAVEKRGVTLGVRGGVIPQEYHQYATLEARSRDVITALEALGDLPNRVLAVGHSEGADVAAKVAAEVPKVSHIAFLSGGGASQLFELMTVIRKSEADTRDKETQIEELWRTWSDISANPNSTDKMFRGHSYRRWSSYIRQAPMDNLLRTEAKILIVHGSADEVVPIESADLCAVELARADKTFEYLRLPEADHSLRTPQQTARKVSPLIPLSYILQRFFLSED